MKKSEIRVGGHYEAKVNGTLTTVRVDGARPAGFRGRETTHYDVTNLSTGRKTTFRSAAKFRKEVKEGKPPLDQEKISRILGSTMTELPGGVPPFGTIPPRPND